MNRKELLHSVILSIGYVLLFIGISNIASANGFLDKYAPFFAVAGALVLYYKKPLSDMIPVEAFSDVIVQAVGMILLFLAFKTYATRYIDGNTTVYIVLGLIIYNYAWPFTRMLIKGEERVVR